MIPTLAIISIMRSTPGRTMAIHSWSLKTLPDLKNLHLRWSTILSTLATRLTARTLMMITSPPFRGLMRNKVFMFMIILRTQAWIPRLYNPLRRHCISRAASSLPIPETCQKSLRRAAPAREKSLRSSKCLKTRLFTLKKRVVSTIAYLWVMKNQLSAIKGIRTCVKLGDI